MAEPNPIDTGALDYKEPDRAAIDRLESRVEELWGSFPVVNTSPTWTPRTLRDQIAFDYSRGRLYYYDFTNQQWRSTITELVDDVTPVLADDLDANGNAIIGLATPTNTTDAATKGYVDGLIPEVGGTLSRITSTQTIASDTVNTTETDIIAYTVTGGTIGSTDTVRIRLFMQYTLASSASPACTLRFKIGSTAISTISYAQGDTTSRTYKGIAECTIQAANSTSSQNGAAKGNLVVDGASLTGTPTIGEYNQSTASVDTTSNHGISATVQFSGTGRGTVTVHTAEIELIRAL